MQFTAPRFTRRISNVKFHLFLLVPCRPKRICRNVRRRTLTPKLATRDLVPVKTKGLKTHFVRNDLVHWTAYFSLLSSILLKHLLFRTSRLQGRFQTFYILSDNLNDWFSAPMKTMLFILGLCGQITTAKRTPAIIGPSGRL